MDDMMQVVYKQRQFRPFCRAIYRLSLSPVDRNVYYAPVCIFLWLFLAEQRQILSICSSNRQIMFPASNKIRLVIALFLFGGALHLIINGRPSVDMNFSIIGIDEADYDPMASIIQNTVTHNSTPDNDSAPVPTIDPELVWQKDWIFNRQPPTLKSCPAKPPKLVGPIRIWLDGPSIESIEKLYPQLEKGGHGKPDNCTAQHRVAIVIPYRNREEHLRILLHNMHSFLRKQQLDYTIVVVEQIANQTFNRAKLMNIGYAEAMKLYPWECFIFHDVDLLPEDDRNLYSCPVQPRHMSVAIDKFNYKLPYGSIFGGISALTVEQFKKINGFSNDYWGWGGEDDDLSTRVVLAGFKISRYPSTIARYKMIKHDHEKSNPVNKCRYKLMAKTKRRYRKDGLSTLNYKVEKLELLPLYVHVVVDLLEDVERTVLKKEVPC